MKTWHIAALVIVGLIVAGIAYTMYEKKKGRRLGGGEGGGGAAVLNNHQRQKDDPSIIPGDPRNGKKEPERPAGPVSLNWDGDRGITEKELRDIGFKW
jgi:hypothetical protein